MKVFDEGSDAYLSSNADHSLFGSLPITDMACTPLLAYTEARFYHHQHHTYSLHTPQPAGASFFADVSWSANAPTYNYYKSHVEQTGYAETKAKLNVTYMTDALFCLTSMHLQPAVNRGQPTRHIHAPSCTPTVPALSQPLAAPSIQAPTTTKTNTCCA